MDTNKEKRRKRTRPSYRQRMPVTELRIYGNGDGYYVCPRCRISLEREFVSYCDRCGQHLNWKQYRHARRFCGSARTGSGIAF